MILLCLGTAWIAGLILGSRIDMGFIFIFSGILPLIFFPLFKNKKKFIILFSLCISIFFTGAWYYGNDLPYEDETNLIFYNDAGTIEIKGVIERYPEQKGDFVRFHLSAESIYRDNEWQDLSGTALVFVPLYSGYEYGDEIMLKGKPETPPELDDFDYEQYLAVKGIYTTFWNPEIEIIDTGQGNVALQWIYTLRNSISDVLGKTLPEPQASFTRGILLGMKDRIPEPVKEDFSVTGTAHLLAISGLHLSILAGIFITLGKRIFGKRGYIYVWLALGAVWVYAMLTGMNPPVIRAAIMITLYLAAELFGRQKNSMTALVFAAAVMTVLTPRILWDASFQMSFAAMIGLIFIFPHIQSACRLLLQSRFSDNPFLAIFFSSVTDSISVSFGAVLAVWPLVTYYFGTFSPIGPIVTLFTIPVLPAVIITGLVCGLSGMVWFPLAQYFGWFSWLAGAFVIKAIDLFSFVPSLQISVGIIPVISYYIILIVAIWYTGRILGKQEIEIPEYPSFRFSKTNILIVFLITAAVFSAAAAFSMPDKDLHVCFLDVGQGDSILIEKGTRQILVDGGPSPDAVMLETGKNMPFWDKTIDLVILTHPDADHITGLIEVLRRYKVKKVIYPDVDSDSYLFSEFKNLLEVRGIENTTVTAGQNIILEDDITIEILHPHSEKTSDDIDNDSIVLNIMTGDISFLLTGDIMKETEIELLTRRAVSRCTVLKIAHHGSAAATSQEFLNVVKPQIAVISCGEDNRFGHPTPKVVERLQGSGTTIYRTDISGTIEFITDGNNLKIITKKHP